MSLLTEVKKNKMVQDAVDASTFAQAQADILSKAKTALLIKLNEIRASEEFTAEEKAELSTLESELNANISTI